MGFCLFSLLDLSPLTTSSGGPLECLLDDEALDGIDREEVVGTTRRFGFAGGTAEIVLALGRGGAKELLRIRALDLREGREFMEGMVGSEETDDKLSFESIRAGGEGRGVVGGGPDLVVDMKDLIDELDDLMDGTFDIEVTIGESPRCCCGCSGCCGCCCCCRIVDIMSEDVLRGIHSATSTRLTESFPNSEQVVEVGTVLLSDSSSESRSVATGVPRASSSIFTTEMECFLVDLLLFSLMAVTELSEPPLDLGVERSFS